MLAYNPWGLFQVQYFRDPLKLTEELVEVIKNITLGKQYKTKLKNRSLNTNVQKNPNAKKKKSKKTNK